jgi:hypothetical protein
LRIDNRTNIVQQPGQARLHRPAAPQMKGIDTHQAAGELAPALADGPLGPPQFTHRRCLTPAPEFLNATRHEHAPRCALQRGRRGGEKGFERFGQLHGLLRKKTIPAWTSFYAFNSRQVPNLDSDKFFLSFSRFFGKLQNCQFHGQVDLFLHQQFHALVVLELLTHWSMRAISRKYTHVGLTH